MTHASRSAGSGVERATGSNPSRGKRADESTRGRSTRAPRSLRDEASAYEPRPAPELPDDAHKGDAGRVLCIAGSRDMPGAAVLVVRSAQRAGAGLVTLGCTAENLRTIVPVAAPEAVLLDLTHAAEKSRAAAVNALSGRDDHARVVGPGMGRSSTTLHFVRAALGDGFQGPLVLDADALNVLEGDLEMLRARRGDLVLTPHPGEAARLLGRTIPRDADGRAAAAREISRRSSAIVCLKGHGTVVAAGERVYVNTTGNPGMATAGAGDVLSGILGAYLAHCAGRMQPDWTIFDAVAAAVHVHGLAGDLAATELGRRALIASDLIDHLPAAQLSFRRARELH